MLTDEQVADFLQAEPEFFMRQPQLLDHLQLTDSHQGAFSLVHVQMSRQRQRIEALENQITTLTTNATNNDRTFYEFMDLQAQLLRCSDFHAVVRAIELKAQQLGLSAYVRLLNQCDVKVQLSAEVYQSFNRSHLQGKTAYLGRLRKVDQEALFGELPVPEMGSYVVLPLVKQQPLGLLAFASEDGGHFQPDMDTLFLRHLSLVVAHLAQTLVWQSNYDPTSASHHSA
nr:DUF484 family protein [Vibrio agarilyticus]